jgi:hypothetical protein
METGGDEEVSDTAGESVPRMGHDHGSAGTNARWARARTGQLHPMAESMGCRASAGGAGDPHVVTVGGRRG